MAEKLTPRVTEKGALGAEAGIYVFNVGAVATKKSIAKEIVAKYKVTPRKIRLLAVPSKKVFIRGHWGKKGGGRKAYIYLKKGDKIEI